MATPISDKKYALVTGGTSGIGLSIVQTLLSEGFYVAINYAANIERAKEVQTQLEVNHLGQFSIVQGDLSNLTIIQPFVQELLDITPNFDVLVFNAGQTDRSPFGEITPEDWNRVLNANLSVPFFLTQSLYPYLSESASITFIGSLMGIRPHAMSVSYGVSKAAVHALTENLVKHVEEKKIRVNAVAPGFVNSPWQKNKPAHIVENINKKVALHRFAECKEIANAVFFLIKNEYMNGEILKIDGGYSYQ